MKKISGADWILEIPDVTTSKMLIKVVPPNTLDWGFGVIIAYVVCKEDVATPPSMVLLKY